jgi:hypothetical protein
MVPLTPDSPVLVIGVLVLLTILAGLLARITFGPVQR